MAASSRTRTLFAIGAMLLALPIAGGVIFALLFVFTFASIAAGPANPAALASQIGGWTVVGVVSSLATPAGLLCLILAAFSYDADKKAHARYLHVRRPGEDAHSP